MKCMIGVDIGGTKISIVKGTPRGKILKKVVLETKVNKHAKQSVDEMVAVIKELVTQAGSTRKLLGIGLGVPGSIDPVKGIITKSPNLPGWAGIQIKKILTGTFKVPVFLDNDANIACIGEKHFGAGKKFKNFLYITVSTGVGAGIVLDNSLIHGADGYAGEVGHIVLHPNGRKCNCGKRGCLEAYASGTAIGKIARESVRRLSAAQKKRSVILKEAGTVSAIDAFAVSKAARKGDKRAQSIYTQMGTDLGTGFGSLLMTLNPDAIILGGSVSKAYPLFASSMRAAMKANAWVPVANMCAIVRSKLGDNVADFGCLGLVLENLR